MRELEDMDQPLLLQFAQFPFARKLDCALQLQQCPFKILKKVKPSHPHAKRAFASAARFFQRLASEAVTDSRAAATSAGVKDFPASGVCAANM